MKKPSAVSSIGAAIFGLGILDQIANVIPMIVPDDFRGIAIAAVGLVIAIAKKYYDKPKS